MSCMTPKRDGSVTNQIQHRAGYICTVYEWLYTREYGGFETSEVSQNLPKANADECVR